MTKQITTLADLTLDSRNANKHNPRGTGQLEKSLRAYGAGRSILVDKHGRVIAGNATLEGAASIGLDAVDVVQSDGTRLVVVQRTDLDLDDPKARELAIADNRVAQVNLEWDSDVLKELIGEDVDLSEFWFEDELAALLSDPVELLESEDATGAAEARKTLAQRFGVPPFSVLDARQGYWQTRKRAWLAMGIQSELGRGEAVTFGDLSGCRNKNAEPGGSARPAARPSPGLNRDGKTQRGDGVGKPLNTNPKGAEDGGLRINSYRRQSGSRHIQSNAAAVGGGMCDRLAPKTPKTDVPRTDEVSGLMRGQLSGTSIFDPVLCELAYRWFCPEAGLILDPFAGGSVRGIVAAQVGRQYLGIDLRAEQIAANEAQSQTICETIRPAWKTGDSTNIAELAAGSYDMIFSCPPYADLEQYSDNPADLSTMPYEGFLAAYRSIIQQCVAMLKANRFACFVVGDIRDKKGFYRNFVSDTIAAFEDAGATLYNEAILVTAVGSLPIRVGKQFGSYRKLGKTHQNVLVFFKGDPKQIPAVYGDCDFSEESPDTESASL